MIPEIIHYCWFGSKEIPPKEKLCIESWKKHFPKYKFIKWNEENFDFNSTTFCKQAYEMKKYAFVSDYVRAKVLYEYGGLYFDTDYEILKPIDALITTGNNILGWENRSNIGTAFMAFEAKHPVMQCFLKYYENHAFMDERGRLDNTANVTLLTDILVSNGLKIDRRLQIVKDLIIYPREYFYPKKLSENEFRVTPDSYGIHHYSMSWLTERQKKRGNNIYWIKIIRPFLKNCRSTCLKIMRKETVRQIEITIRNFLK